MDIEQKIKELTLEEKASICVGKNVWYTKNIDRLGIKSIMMTDGPHGIRKQKDESDNFGLNNSVESTSFPTAATTACSFDRDLLKEMGEAIAKEAKSLGISIVLGPGMNIKRSPLCGRNFEYFSEDPYLTGELARSMVFGIQSQNIGSCVKHFAANNQESLRMSISSEVDERALHEIYLKAFEYVVKHQPSTLMTSYNKVNGTYVSESKEILHDILRNKWGYQGVVMSDWGGTNDRVKALEAGLDLEMPYSGEYNIRQIVEAVQYGRLQEDILDQSVRRLLKLVNQFESNKVIQIKEDVHHELARKIARESAVLLQNKDSLLPLSKQSKIAVVGEFSVKPRFQGGGSSHITPKKVDSFLDYLYHSEIEYEYAAGYDINKSDDVNLDLIEDAKLKADGKDAVVIFIGLTDDYESEGFDRIHLSIPKSHSMLIGEISQVNPNIIVVLQCGSPIIMPWKNYVKGILHSYLGGEATNLAIADLIFGDFSPSGKLAESYPIDLDDCPSYSFFPGGNTGVHYKESIYVGYRFYDTFEKPVLYPFGYGLSYSSFEYSDLKLSSSEIESTESLKISFKIKNTGSMKAKEVCQLYIKNAPSIVFKAKKELKEFMKVECAPGEEKEITVDLSPEAFAYYNINIHDWHVESGEYHILLGSSSSDIRLEGNVYINNLNKKIPLPNYQAKSNSYYTTDFLDAFFDNEWKGLVGEGLLPLNEDKRRPFTLNSTLEDVKKTYFGKILNKSVHKQIKKMFSESDGWTYNMIEKVAVEQPLRSLVSGAGGVITKEMMIGMLEMINGHYRKGLGLLLKANKQKKLDYKKEH